MHCLEIYAILTIFLVYVTGDENYEQNNNMSSGNEIESSTGDLTLRSKINSSDDRKKQQYSKFWMHIWGPIQQDLLDVQAIIIKEEKFQPKCGRGDRSKRRHLMCAGSILSANLVLTSATCLHTATHMRHNIRGTLAVAISAVKPTMEIIRVAEYRIHDDHNADPFAPTFIKNNVAILKLACDITKANFHKIILPRVPFLEICSRSNCLVTVFGRMRKTNWMMFQMYAPNTTLSDRRKKETMINDEGIKGIEEYKINEMTRYGNKRFKRKLAEPPNFVGFYDSQKAKKSNIFLTNFTTKSTNENSLVQQKAMVSPDTQDSSFVEAIRLEDDDVMNYSNLIGNETLKTIVSRSLSKQFGCAHTGAPIMLGDTQYAIAVLPCDNRRPWTKWAYADLYDNLDWIDEVFQDWSTQDNMILPARAPEVPSGIAGNHSSCSTCIFNFFIDLGCKDKNRCGNKTTTVHTNKAHDYRRIGDSVVLNNSKSCPGSKGMGIDVGISRGCRKKNQKLQMKSNRHENWAKSYNPRIPESSEPQNSRDPSSPNVSKLKQPVAVESLKTSLIKDLPDDKDKLLPKDNSRISEIPRDILERPSFPSPRYTFSRNDYKKHEKTSNEIGPQKIESHSNYRIAQNRNPFGITPDAKRRLIESARSH